LAPAVVSAVAVALERVAQTVPILLVEQNLAVVRRLAGTAVVLSAGRVAWHGAAADLLGSPDQTRALLGVGSTARSA
jgi:branched-chain amino acid transport system ATP-binding protein